MIPRTPLLLHFISSVIRELNQIFVVTPAKAGATRKSKNLRYGSPAISRVGRYTNAAVTSPRVKKIDRRIFWSCFLLAGNPVNPQQYETKMENIVTARK